jgi:hypothetical protein
LTQLTDAQKEQAKNDLLLRDLELRAEQLRQLKVWEPWKVAFAGMTAGGGLVAIGALIAKLIH